MLASNSVTVNEKIVRKCQNCKFQLRHFGRFSNNVMKKKSSYTENGVDKRIQTTVAHSYPMTDKENHIDVFIPRKG